MIDRFNDMAHWLIIHGTKNMFITTDEFLIRCPACEKHSWADVAVRCSYFHFYYVPLFPTGKEADVICQECGMKRYGIPLGEYLLSNYKEVKKRFKTPWFAYTGLLIILFIILTSVIAGAIESWRN